MTQYKIVYNRNICIGANSCVAASEKFWEMAEDSKANLKGSKFNEEKEVYELEINEDGLDKALESVQVCPVYAISVYKKEESGEWVKIAPED